MSMSSHFSSRSSVNLFDQRHSMEFDPSQRSSSVATELLREEEAEDEVTSVKNADLLETCDLFRQMTIETIKMEQNNVSGSTIKEKQMRTYQKLENLQIDLLRLIKDLRDTVTYNPFVGVNQSKIGKLAEDKTLLRSSFIVEDEDFAINGVGVDEGRRLAASKSKQSEKKRLAKLVEKMIYQLEKLRFSLEKKVYPRDMTLRLFDCKD